MDEGNSNSNSNSSSRTRYRMVGEYIIGPRIGSGSFAVVWRSKHRHTGTEFAIKEIDKKHLVNDNLKKEISILRNTSHPNIIRLFDAIETEDKIFLVLEYCDGGDLGAYIHKHGRVSEDVAKHFLKQLAAGLQVLRDNHLIHRDLKPQNLLLSGKGATPLLKIGDFGFARYLTPQGLADTLCGSPLYMAPEIIQNQKYDAKADLWSVGAILYQLVIGKPPFDGNSQLQLFQNVLASTELRFPVGSLEVLHPDFVDLCRSLLRRNPVERLTFEEFFNHRFLTEHRVAVDAELSSQISGVHSLVIKDSQWPQLHQDDKLKVSDESLKQDYSANDEKGEPRKVHSTTHSASGVAPNTSSEKMSLSVQATKHGKSQIRVADSLELIERGYVLVHSNFASMEILTSSLGTSLKESSTTKTCALAPKNNNQLLPISSELKELPVKFGKVENTWRDTEASTASDTPCIFGEARGLHILHPSTRLQILYQYLVALSNLAREKLNGGSFLESFSVELVVLASWREFLRICSSWMTSAEGSDLPECSSNNETTVAANSLDGDTLDFTKPSSVFVWAEQGFVAAYDRTEKLSKYIQDGDGAMEMPDAMEVIFQAALSAGRDGAADQLIGNQESAATLYSKALLLFSFIVAEAPLLPLNPPFTLDTDSKQRILKYIKNLESHLSHSQMPKPSVKQLPGYTPK